MQRQCYRARWVFPADAGPLENGTVEIEDGRITAVHDRHDPRAVDLGHAVVIPGLVNAHTHLEFSDLTQPLEPAQPFAEWMRTLVAYRRNRTLPPAEIVECGLEQSRQMGTTLVGEIATNGWSPKVFSGDLPRGVAFREVIAPNPENAADGFAIAQEHLQATAADEMLVRGISPHAPYSVHPDLFRQLVDLAAEFRAPLTMHLAETKAELELLDCGTGEMVEMMRGFEQWHDNWIPRGSRPLDYLKAMAELPQVVIAHGNYLAAEEIEFVAAHPNLCVVYCPRTHAYFGHKNHPWRQLLERGANVAVGTDGRCSNPDLSIWRELLFLRKRHPDVTGFELLQLGTIRGARALGLAQLTGSLTPGKSADLAVVQLGEQATGDPYELLFQPTNQISATMRSGRWVWK